MTRLLSILREPMVARHLLAWIVFAAIGAELLTPDREVTRIRNSLLATVADPSSFEWRPDETPPDFLRERGPKPPELLAAARSIGADARDGQGALARSLRIARHLARGGLHGTMLHLDTVSAYQAILATGEGDCSDYTQVFDAISYVADIPVRQWGISFDGFGGSGHTFNEIFDAGLDKWVMVDVFRSFIPIDRMSGVPLSTLEFRRRMRGIDPLAHMRIIPLTRAPSAAFEREIVQYFAAGNDQYFLWWGNNTLSYDANPLVRTLAPWSRAGQQLVGIMAGIHPVIRIVSTSSNGTLILKLHLTAALVTGWLLAAVIVAYATWWQLSASSRV